MANVSSSNGLEKRPKLRFPGFDEPWKKCEFKEFAKVNPKCQSIPEQFYYIDLGSVEDGELSNAKIENALSAPSRAQRLLSCNDVLFQTVRPYQQNNYLFCKERSLPTVASTGYAVFRTKYDVPFLYALIHTGHFLNSVLSRCTGTSFPAVSASDIEEILVSIPSLGEQQKIGELFRLLNSKIRKQKALIESLKKYKRGLLSNAFRNASSWRKKRLGEICCIRTGKLDANAMVNDGKYPFFTCARERYSIDTYAFDTDALLISGNGANVGYIHHYTGKFNAYQRTYVLDQFQEDINYVHVYLNRFLSSRIDAEKKAGNTPYIVLSTLSDMEIYIPDETTTKQLVDLFTQIENRISYSATVLEYLSSQRRGLLQQLFI